MRIHRIRKKERQNYKRQERQDETKIGCCKMRQLKRKIEQTNKLENRNIFFKRTVSVLKG